MGRLGVVLLFASGCDCYGSHRADPGDGDLDTDADTDTASDTVSDVDTDTGSDTGSGSASDTDTGSESETESESASETDSEEPDPCPDVDGDGWDEWDCGGDDCEDGDASIHPCASDGSSWHIERISREGNYQTGSMTMGLDGTLHVAAWNQDDLVHFHHDGAGWEQTVLVEDVGCCISPEIAIGADGEPRIAFTDDGTLRLATRGADGVWDVEDVDDDASTWFPSIAATADGAFEIAYLGDGDTDLRHATNAAGAWSTTVVDSADQILAAVVAFNPLVIASDGTAHVAYTVNHGRLGEGGQDYELFLATHDGADWAIESIEREERSGEWASMVVDGDDVLHLFYSTGELGGLHHTSGVPGAFTREGVDATADAGRATSAVIDASGAIHVAYTVATPGELRYATDASGSWQTDTVSDECSAGYGEWTSIAADDVVHVLYARTSIPDSGALEVATSVEPVFDGIDQDCDGLADE